MVKTTKWLTLLMVTTIVLSACKKDQPEDCSTDTGEVVKVTVQPMYGSETLYLDSVYTTAEGYDVQFTEIKFLAHKISGTSQIKDAAFYDFRTTGTTMFQTNAEIENLTNLTMFLGVDGDDNHADPAAFPNESVLNISNSGGMHWGWNPGYIFLKVEGKVDTIPDGNPLFDRSFVFHIGKDENLKTLTFNNANWQTQSDNSRLLALKLDMQKFLQNGTEVIDLKTEYTSHTAPGQEQLSEKVIQNFKDAISEF